MPMELVDEFKGMLKAAGTQIKSCIKGGEHAAEPAEASLQVNNAEKVKVATVTESQEQQTDSWQRTTDEINPVIDRVFQLRENFVIIGLTGRTGSGGL